jgi:hypothetical protein
MEISRDALKATDHARGPGAIRGCIPCDAERVEKVREPRMNWSVVVIRLLIRAPNCGSTGNKCSCQRAEGDSESEEKRE